MRRLKRLLGSVFVGFIALALAAGLASGGERRALLVGVKDYADPLVPKLDGPENDVALLADVLKKHYGFRDADLKILLSRGATRAAILAATEEWLIRGVRAEDMVLFYYSGHGSQTADLNGDEDDGLDEFLVAHDFEMKAWKEDKLFRGGILDDELGQLIERIPADSVTVILDACHSGTGTREISFSLPTRQRYIAPPQWVFDQAKRVARSTRDITRVTLVDKPPERAVLLAASTAADVAEDAPFEVGGKQVYHGALTFLLARGLQGAAAPEREKAITYRDAWEYVRKELKAAEFKQEPQLEGQAERLSRALFFQPPQTAGRSGRVIRTDGRLATFELGGYEGVAIGSVFGAYPPETASPQAALRKGKIEVTAVRDHEADGQISEGRAEARDRVFEEQRAFALGPLEVFVEVAEASTEREAAREAASAISDRLRSANYLRVLDRTAISVKKIVRVSATREGGGVLYSAQIIDRYGQEGAAHSERDVRELAGQVLNDLDRLDLLRRLAQLRNPNPGFRIRLETSPPGAGRFRLKEKVAYRFTSDRDCHLLLLNVGPDGNIALLFPNPWHKDSAVRAGQVYEIPSREMDFDIVVRPPVGPEVLKAIATLSAVRVRGVDGARGIDQGFQVFARGAARGGEITARGMVEEITERTLAVEPKRIETPGAQDAKQLLTLPFDQWSEVTATFTTSE